MPHKRYGDLDSVRAERLATAIRFEREHNLNIMARVSRRGKNGKNSIVNNLRVTYSGSRERMVLEYGICSRDDVISSLRKDRLREIDACTSACRTPGNPPNHYGSLDVAPVSNREQDYRGFRTSIRTTSRCDGSAVVDILRHDLSVVLDFPANTVRWRSWMRSLITEAGVAHELHILDVPDTICKQRLRQRNLYGKHPYEVSEETYELFTSYFVPPEPDEGFNIVTHIL